MKANLCKPYTDLLNNNLSKTMRFRFLFMTVYKTSKKARPNEVKRPRGRRGDKKRRSVYRESPEFGNNNSLSRRWITMTDRRYGGRSGVGELQLRRKWMVPDQWVAAAVAPVISRLIYFAIWPYGLSRYLRKNPIPPIFSKPFDRSSYYSSWILFK